MRQLTQMEAPFQGNQNVRHGLNSCVAPRFLKPFDKWISRQRKRVWPTTYTHTHTQGHQYTMCIHVLHGSCCYTYKIWKAINRPDEWRKAYVCFKCIPNPYVSVTRNSYCLPNGFVRCNWIFKSFIRVLYEMGCNKSGNRSLCPLMGRAGLFVDAQCGCCILLRNRVPKWLFSTIRLTLDTLERNKNELQYG